MQGFGRVEGYQKGAQGSEGYQGSGSGGSGSAGNPPSFESGSGSGSYSQSGNTVSGSGYESGARAGNQPGLGSGSSNKYSAGQALADQGVADQAAFVGSKTLGHHNVPDNYEKEAPVLPGQQEYSSAHSSQSTGGQSAGGQAGGARSTNSGASTQVCIDLLNGNTVNRVMSILCTACFCQLGCRLYCGLCVMNRILTDVIAHHDGHYCYPTE